jgi:hypothetical protein
MAVLCGFLDIGRDDVDDADGASLGVIQPSCSTPARGGTEGGPRQIELFCYRSIEGGIETGK